MAADGEDHRAWVLWAADCAQHVLPVYERHHPDDDRPRRAVAAARAWARGDLGAARARATAFTAYAAARDAENQSARAAALAAGHAAAAVHVAAHAQHAADDAVVAAAHAVPGANHDTGLREREWQDAALPRRLRLIVAAARQGRSA